MKNVEITGDRINVVRCKDCRFCKPLSITPGFYCERTDMDFCAPHYDNAAWYCADGERREAGE